tara:strand:- start:6816 stop:8981 length:2166 start_codon:yes stop_codon:yes gene_type:complete
MSELEKRLETLEKMEKVLEKNKELTNDQLQMEADIARAQAQSAEALGDYTGRREAQIRLLESEIRLNAENAAAAKELIQALKDGNVALTEQNDLLNSLSPEARKVVDAYQEMNQVSEAQNKYGKNQKSLLQDIAGSMGIVTEASSGFLGKLIKASHELKEGGGPAAASLAAEFKDIFNFTTLTLTSVTKIAEATAMLVIEADKASAALARATGTGREFASSMIAAQDAGNLLGVRLENAGKSTSALVTQTTNFVNLSKTAQTSLITQTALLERLGVSNEMATETFQFLNVNLGMTAAQTEAATTQLAMMGTELGISAEQITSDFNQSLGVLAVYGSRSMQVFQGLASAAKVAGVEVSTLLSIAKKFDTFQGAAEGAAKFNALLGTQLSTTEMLMMTEEQRIETLIRQTQAQGVAFGDMDKFSQMALASAAGIEDMNEAQRIFGMNLGQYQQYRSEMERSANAQTKFEDAIRATAEIQDKFKILAAEFAVMIEPVLEGIHATLDGVLTFLESFPDESRERFMKIIGAIGTFAIALKVIAPLIAIATGGFGGLAATLGIGGAVAAGAGGVAASGGLVAGITAVTTAIGPLLLGIGALAAAAAGLGALGKVIFGADTSSIDAATVSMSELGDSAQRLNESDNLLNIGTARPQTLANNAVLENAQINNLAVDAATGRTIAGVTTSGVRDLDLVTQLSNALRGQQISLNVDGQQMTAFVEMRANAQ